jgi:hypothetical protein
LRKKDNPWVEAPRPHLSDNTSLHRGRSAASPPPAKQLIGPQVSLTAECGSQINRNIPYFSRSTGKLGVAKQEKSSSMNPSTSTTCDDGGKIKRFWRRLLSNGERMQGDVMLDADDNDSDSSSSGSSSDDEYNTLRPLLPLRTSQQLEAKN